MPTDNTRPSRLSLISKSTNKRLTRQLKIPFNAKCLLILASVFALPTQSIGLTLQQAESLAASADPRVASHQATARALLDESISDATLPDPKFRLGLFNLPVDSLSTTQEGSTQLRLGIQQAFPGCHEGIQFLI